VPDKPKQKVFCVGFQKTGTTSLRDALGQMGYKVASVYAGDVSLEEMRAVYVAMGLELAKQYDAVQDMPWPLIFRELDAAFPGSKFILTERDPDRWYKSITGHFGAGVSPRQQLTYGDDYGTPVGNEAHYRAVYLAHNAAVKDYFAGRPDDLLVMDLEKGHGWNELSAFLGLKNAPTGPFVHTNSAADRQKLSYRAKQKLRRIKLRLQGKAPQ
jgi:hypothetical protein